MMIILFEEEFIPDAEISPIIEEQVAKAEEGMDKVVGYAAVNLTNRTNYDAQSLVGNMIVDAMRNEVKADFAFLIWEELEQI